MATPHKARLTALCGIALVCQKNQIYGQQQQGRRNFAEWRDKNEKDNKKKTDKINNDFTGVFTESKYSTPVSVDGIEVIKQDVSCGYAVIEMFSAWNGGSITEKTLYDEYGKVVTSTGKNFCTEMNKQFPQFTTSMHKYLTNTELIDAVYSSLKNDIPVPFEWAALCGDEWTLHYSL